MLPQQLNKLQLLTSFPLSSHQQNKFGRIVFSLYSHHLNKLVSSNISVVPSQLKKLARTYTHVATARKIYAVIVATAWKISAVNNMQSNSMNY